MWQLVKSAATLRRNNWESRETMFRLVILLAVVGIIAAAFLLHDRFTFTHLGYAGGALSSLLASGGILVPVPALAVACAASFYLTPLLVALVAAAAESVGELTGNSLGYTGRGFIQRRPLHQRLEQWMERRGWLLLFVLAVIPNPVFDVAGVAAGGLRYPLWRFLGVVAVGKLIKFVALVYACVLSVEWLTEVFL